MDEYRYLDYTVTEGVALLTLKSTDGMNTQSVASVAEWGEAISAANRDDTVGAIVITSAGKVFCAGGDMNSVFLPRSSGELPYDENDPYTGGLSLLSTDWTQLLRDSKPIVVAFNGHAVGGGITFFLAADVLLASEQASFHFSFTRLGIVPEMCSSKYLPARVGFGRSSEILLTGRTVAAAEALNIGLVDYLHHPDRLLEGALNIARQIAGNPQPMLKMTKKLLDQNSLEDDTDRVWERESRALSSCFAMDEHKQAVSRFLKK